MRETSDTSARAELSGVSLDGIYIQGYPWIVYIYKNSSGVKNAEYVFLRVANGYGYAGDASLKGPEIIDHTKNLQ